MRFGHKWVGLALLAGTCISLSAEAASCVWKVTAPDGKSAFLGGSIHALNATDYPLPPAFNRAFDASTNLAFEVDRKALVDSSRNLVKSGEYPKGDSLKNHVDPRTYDYMKRLFGLLKVKEDKFAQFKPWFIVIMLQSGSGGMSNDLGVDQYLMNRASARSKPVVGLESVREHAEVYSGLTDRQGEALLLMSLIPQATGKNENGGLVAAWRRGDADTVAQYMKESFRDYPAFGERLLEARNRAWIPKIEGYIRGGRTYFVVAGAAHFGGPNGVLSLLRSRGYKVEAL